MSDIPMPEPTVARRPFSSFKVISYDIFGTLIDWEGGIYPLLQPLVERMPADASSEHAAYRSAEGRSKVVGRFHELEATLQTSQPSALYSSILEQAFLLFAQDMGIEADDEVKKDAKAFGASVGSWPAFPDTVDACQRLAKAGYKMIPLSNVDRESFSHTLSGPLKGVDFFRVYTAQDIGSYKPDLRNFEYLVRRVKEDAAVDKDDILHVAQSLFHDHQPAKKFGMSSVWINRRGASMGSPGGAAEMHSRGEVGYGWRYRTLGEFADEVERQSKEEGGK
ncbi:uncharacterized protein A1O9_03084 [Exophiala aquamarina CBS 119918]|uniref:Haloacid dehalogenase, type II n=1 Tax=Exophiala aquamarina CBS 119918 TaxID=1182545 RepID=A0A072PP45_9EURO|nr:uncharacterized protein A1O9_03084 [Exophiala aquamarina CBS 119918]KEF61517.1 hypothetical protein A1O9_03084 [Exophiala aquamarina CBS 119918]